METQDARVVDMRAVGTNVWLVKLPNPLAKVGFGVSPSGHLVLKNPFPTQALDALEKETTIGSMRIYQPSDDSDEPDAKRARVRHKGKKKRRRRRKRTRKKTKRKIGKNQ